MTRIWSHFSVAIVAVSGALIGFGFWRLLNHPSLDASWDQTGEISWVSSNSVADRSLDVGDRIVSVGGNTPADVAMLLPGVEIGDRVLVEFEHAHRVQTVELTADTPAWGQVSLSVTSYLLAFFYWSVGWLLVKRAHRLNQMMAAGAAGAFFSFVGVLLALGEISGYGPTWASRMFSVGLWWVAPVGTLLHLWFPRPLSIARKPLTSWVLALSGLAGGLWAALSPANYLQSVNLQAHQAGYLWLGVHLVLSVGLLVYRWWRSPSLGERRQLGLIAAGGIVSMGSLVALTLIPRLVSGPSNSAGLGLELLPLALLPASYGYAFLRYRRMAQDRDQRIAKLLIYAFTAVVMGLCIALGFAIPGVRSLSFDSLIWIAVVWGALVSSPLTRWLEQSMGRLIFGHMQDPLKQTAQATDALDLSIEKDNLSEQVAAVLRHHLDIEQSAVLILDSFSVLADASQTGLAGAANGVPVYRGSKLENLLLDSPRVLEFDEIASQLSGTNAAPLLQVPWARALVPLTSRGDIVGVLLISYRTGTTFLSTQDLIVLKLVAQALATAIQRRSLVRILQDKSAEAVMLTQEILRVRNEERKRIARDLHDDIIQPMIAASYNVAMFEDEKAPAVRQNLLDLIELTRSICFELRQPALDTLGFGAAARTAVNDFRLQSHLDASIAIDEAPGIVVPEHVAAAALGLLGEALQNAHKHAEAKAVTVNVVVHPDQLKVRVKDDGRGFDLNEAQARAARTKHFGLQTMGERVAGAGGTYNIMAAPGQGACVEAIFPLTPPTSA